MEEQRPQTPQNGGAGAGRPPASRPAGSRPPQRAGAQGSGTAASRSGGKKKKKKRRQSGVVVAAKAILYVVCVIGVSVVLAMGAWICAQDVLALNKDPLTAVVHLPESAFYEDEITVKREGEDGKTVKEKETVTVVDLDYVADMLKANGIIEYKPVFKVFASFTGAKQKLVPGTYTLSTDMDYRAIISSMGGVSGNRVEVTITIPEGFSLKQIFNVLEENEVCTVEQLMETAATHDYEFDFLADIPMGDASRLEGYLFPDTYRFFVGEDPVYAINKMLVNFDKRFTQSMREEVAEKGMTIQDIVTIASLIEKETDGTDRALISSVIYNRMAHPERETAGLLQIDAAIYYVTGRKVTQDDYQNVDSPYNTYLYPGLPPTAIANPGAEALWSAIHPKDTDFYYYALGEDKVHHFSKTYKEHQKFLASLPEKDD